MTEADFEEMEQAERQRHDDKVEVLEMERKEAEKKGYLYLTSQVKNNNESNVLYLLGTLVNKNEDLEYKLKCRDDEIAEEIANRKWYEGEIARLEAENELIQEQLKIQEESK